MSNLSITAEVMPETNVTTAAREAIEFAGRTDDGHMIVEEEALVWALAEIDRLRVVVQYEVDCVEAAKAEIDRLTREHDEARAERDALRLAIDRHRRNVWGDLSVRYSDAVRHPEDSSLYAALAQIEQERPE